MNKKEEKLSQKVIVKRYKGEILCEYALYRMIKLYVQRKGDGRV